MKNGRWGYTAGCVVRVKKQGYVICVCCKEFKKAGEVLSDDCGGVVCGVCALGAC